MTQTFVIVERQNLVLFDLTQQIREVAPGAAILTFVALDDAIPEVARLKTLTGAIVDAPFDELRNSPFPHHVSRLDAWLVCMNDRHKDEIRAEGWHLLPMPFSSDAAIRLFGNLMQSPRPAAM